MIYINIDYILAFFRYIDFPEGPKPGYNDIKLYNNPSYERKTSSKRKNEEDVDIENYYTYPKHLHTDSKNEKRPPLPSDKGKIKSGKEKIKKKSKDKKKQKIDPSLYGGAFYNKAFDGDDRSGKVENITSDIYESIRIPDPNYQSLERKNAADKNGTTHSNHGYLSIERKQGKGYPTNFDALRFQPGVTDSKFDVTNDGYLEPVTLRRESDKNKLNGDNPVSRGKKPQVNPLHQRMNSDDTDAGYDKQTALRQDSGYHSQKPSQRSQKSIYQLKDPSRSKSGSRNSYAGYYPGDKRSIVFDPRNPNQSIQDPYGSSAAVYQDSDLQQNPMFQGSTSDITSGRPRSGRSQKMPKDVKHSGSGNVYEDKSMYIDLPLDPANPNGPYDRADRLVHKSRSKNDAMHDLYNRPDGLTVSNGGKKLRRYDNDLNVVFDKADGAKAKSPSGADSDKLNNLYNNANAYQVPSSDINKNSDFNDLYDRADGLKNVKSKHTDNNLYSLYDRADNVIPSGSGKKRLPRQPMTPQSHDGRSRHSYIQVIP